VLPIAQHHCGDHFGGVQPGPRTRCPAWLISRPREV
jgi:hypothetical protein